jgi:hypothetical protein
MFEVVMLFVYSTPEIIFFKVIISKCQKMLLQFLSEAGATFNNSFFDNSFGFLRQFKNRSFLDPVFVHATGRRQN